MDGPDGNEKEIGWRVWPEMKVSKQFCDQCRKECSLLYAIDIDLPLELRMSGKMKHYPIGRYTMDNVWEVELCSNCVVDAMNVLGESLCQ